MSHSLYRIVYKFRLDEKSHRVCPASGMLTLGKKNSGGFVSSTCLSRTPVAREWPFPLLAYVMRGYFLRSFIHANEYFNLDYDERLMRHGLASGSKLKFDVKFLLSNYTRPIKFTVLIMDSLWIIRLRIFRACGYINGSRGRFSERRRDYKFYLTCVYILRFKFIFYINWNIARLKPLNLFWLV